jgi:hypothetical protein
MEKGDEAKPLQRQVEYRDRGERLHRLMSRLQ